MNKLDIDQMVLVARAEVSRMLNDFQRSFYENPQQDVSAQYLRQELQNAQIQDQRQGQQLVQPR